MLSRRYLAAAVLAAGLALTAAGPAVAATTTSASPEPTSVATPSTAIPEPTGVFRVPRYCNSGEKTTAAQATECKALVAQKSRRPFPKGAPATGGGAMAAEVSSWR